MNLPALLLQAFESSGDDAPQSVVVGYVIVAAGVLDIVIAILLAMSRKPADKGPRSQIAEVMGLAGAGMIVIGALFWMGVLGG